VTRNFNINSHAATLSGSQMGGDNLPHSQNDGIGVAYRREAQKPTTFATTHPTTLSNTSPEYPVLCLSLLGLTLSAAVLSYASPETISIMFSFIG
jgi:hypothetical protein